MEKIAIIEDKLKVWLEYLKDDSINDSRKVGYMEYELERLLSLYQSVKEIEK